MTTPSSSLPPTNPYHISRAYGVQPVAPVAKPRVLHPVQPVQKTQQQAPPAKIDEGVTGARRLVGGVVPGRVDFTAGEAKPSSSAAIPMYRHPADKNTAATGVVMGKAIDISG